MGFCSSYLGFLFTLYAPSKLSFRFLSYFKENAVVQHFLRGLRPAVIALIGIAAYSLAQKGIKDWFAIILGIAAFIVVYWKKV